MRSLKKKTLLSQTTENKREIPTMKPNKSIKICWYYRPSL